MNCFICEEPINDDFKALLPCCNSYVHTICLIPFAEQHYNHNKPNVICNCGEILHRFNTQYQQTDPLWLTVDEVKDKMNAKMSQPAFKKATILARSKMRAKNTAQRAFEIYLTNKARLFKDAINTYRDTIKTLKDEAIKEIKLSAEYINFQKASMQTTRAITKFIADTNVTNREAHIHIGKRGRHYRWYRISGSWLISRKFRIRIN